MEKTVKQLEGMIGRRFMYMGEKLLIHDVDYTDDNISVFTSDKTLSFTEKEAREFMDDARHIEDTSMAVVKPMAEQSTDLFRSMKTIMEETIQKVSNDREYVDQAKQINDSVKNMLEMSRQQVDLIKVLKK